MLAQAPIVKFPVVILCNSDVTDMNAGSLKEPTGRMQPERALTFFPSISYVRKYLLSFLHFYWEENFFFPLYFVSGDF